MNGRELTKDELEKIALTFKISNHGLEKLSSRSTFKTISQIRKALLHPYFCFWNTDGTANIYITEYDYFVFGNKWGYGNLITYKEKSGNGKNCFDKQALAKKGINGRYFYGK